MDGFINDAIFTLSIEPMGDRAYQHGFHLGTDETIARQIAVEMFEDRNAFTVALKRAGRIVDVYDGRWFSDYA